jgi:hypothetical protein
MIDISSEEPQHSILSLLENGWRSLLMVGLMTPAR